MNLESIQRELQKTGLDGWLFFDHHERDPLAYRVLGLKPFGLVSGQWCCFIPAQGEPRGLAHQVEPHVLDALPGAKIPYARWQEQQSGLRQLLQDAKQVALQYFLCVKGRCLESNLLSLSILPRNNQALTRIEARVPRMKQKQPVTQTRI